MTFIKFGRYVTPDGKYLVMPDLKKLNLPIKEKKQVGMIPILYESTETAFASNGLGRLRDCLSCIVTEERNGIYECDFEYPVTGANFDEIMLGRIIGVTHDESEDIQPFDIVSYTRPINGVVTFHCVHISYRQSFMTVTGSSINSLADAFTLLGTAEPSNPFTYSTDMTSSAYFAAADGLPHSVRQMLGGMEGSILDAYGGEYEWDKFNVMLHSARGQTRSFDIRYGVNMVDFNDEMDNSSTYSSCVPYWTDGTNTVIGDVVSSSDDTITGRDECVPLDLSDKFESQPTKAQVEAMASTYLASNNTHLPQQTISVEFVRLQDMGFTQFDELLECKLCDTINVIFPSYNMSSRFKIVKTVWNVLRGRYDSMELGNLSTSLAEALGIDSMSSSSFIAEEYYSKASSISVGTLITGAVLTGAGGVLRFSIPTGRIFPAGTTITAISFDIVARVSNSNGTGYYIVKKTSGGTDLATFSSTASSTFYNAGNTQQTLATSKWSVSLEGGTNIYIDLDSSTNYFFSGTSTINNYVNNNAAVVHLKNIAVTLSNPNA